MTGRRAVLNRRRPAPHRMKHHLLSAALLLVAFSATALADSPEAILKDYRKQATQVVERLNQSLEKAATPLIAKLVKDGDTAGADELKTQLKAKLAGDQVPTPQASAAQLFAQYDEARAKSLAPIQKSCIARVDSLLKAAGSSKLETVTELGKVRAEIEEGKLTQRQAPAVVPQYWVYHMQKADNNPLSNIELKPTGEFIMSGNPSGRWKRAKGTDVITITFPDKPSWTVTLSGDGTATIDRPDVGRRYMEVVPDRR